MSRDYGSEISAAKADLAQQIAQLDTYQQKFLSEATTFLRAWCWSTAEEVVGHNPDLTKMNGTARLAELKAKVKHLQDRAEETVSEFLQDEELWWHRSRKQQSYFFTGLRMPDALARAVDLAAGRLVPVLQEFGYLKKKPGEYWSDYLEWDKSGNHHPPNARPSYRVGVWPQDMQEPIRQYETLQSAAAKAVSGIESLERQQAQSEAQSLWDQA